MSKCVKCRLDIGETIYVRCGPCSDEFNKATAERDRAAVEFAESIACSDSPQWIAYEKARERLASLEGREG